MYRSSTNDNKVIRTVELVLPPIRMQRPGFYLYPHSPSKILHLTLPQVFPPHKYYWS